MASADQESRTESDARLIYDGQCPLCRSFVSRYGLSEGRLELVDARHHPEEVRRLERLGCRLDEGMVLELGDERYHGDQAVRMAAVAGRGRGPLSRGMLWWLSSRRRARLSYPLLKAVRRVMLKGLGVGPIRP
ncbi:DCC1-like thiol-disulfide oxidoreductase family protein [Halomonas sp. BN3-1]|uniref:DCC1-like thiol-disulfide oxidoreductase family protein n=1 Tax=Halomonas sp. BN3-1 TaxID=2082393 RepID=UPI000D388D3F|nr:DCC1-like thiol-disulfide oxidoreductase family protein [Halomonas sp. BN3-1]MBR9770548.1 DUF393 domain-containing protein [Gammaproteobacteria bacterium]